MDMNGNSRPVAPPTAGQSMIFALVLPNGDPRMKLELCQVTNGVMVARVDAVGSNVQTLIDMLESAANQLRAQSGGVVRVPS